MSYPHPMDDKTGFDATDAEMGLVPAKGCTCHPDDNPPVPCPRKYALTDCRMDAERFATCPHCCGEGEWDESRPQWDDPGYAVSVRCDECNGSGWVYAHSVLNRDGETE